MAATATTTATTTAMTTPERAMGEALHDAVTRLRARLGDATAPIVVLVPAGPNSVLARTALARRTSFLRVWFDTPDGLAEASAPLSLWRRGTLEPAGWRRPILRRLIARLADEGRLGTHAQVLRRRGWLEPLLQTLARLEGHGVTATDLEAVAVRSADVAVAERARLMGTILGALTAARDERGLFTAADLATAARVAVEADEVGTGAALARGVVVVGDRELPRCTFDFLVAWLARRPGGAVVTVRPPALQHLAPAPLGLRAAVVAAGHRDDGHDVIAVAPSPSPGLARLHEGLFAAVSAPAVVDDSVELARTPDDVRECSECVREVKRVIARGTSLDQIAIVLPDSRQRGALEDALERARIPTTWLIGHPASSLPPARLLSLAVAVAGEPGQAGSPDEGEQTVERLYELLQHPALQLRGALGPDAVAGRGRWRRLLGRVARARGFDGILRALSALDHSRPGVSEADRVAEDRDRIAAASLLHTLTALRAALTDLATPATLPEHARRWSAFLETWARAGESRARLLKLLQPIALASSSSSLSSASSSSLSPVLGLVEAREELERTLEREISRGSLTERSIRVLSPLHLLGGSFDTVCVLGLSEGRFPSATREDSLAPDALLVALADVTGAPLPGSAAHQALEQRRFAAVVGAARRRVWLSLPRLDFATERPTLPSSLALSAASALLGRRASFADVDRLVVQRGRRAFSWPDDPAAALDHDEHLLARSAARAPSALVALSSQPFSRGHLQLQRSMHEAARGGPLDAWTGRVSPSVLAMPGLDGAPIALRLLVDLLASPADVFFQRLLRTGAAGWLRPWGDPVSLDGILERLVAVGRVTVTDGGLDRVLRDAVAGELDALVGLGGLDAADVALARPILGREAKDLAGIAAAWCRTPPPLNEPLPVDSALPWRVTGLVGRVLADDDGAVLKDLKDDFRAQSVVKDNPDLALSALALLTRGADLEGVAVIAPTGTSKTFGVEKLDPYREALTKATTLAVEGLWPMATSKHFGLAIERRKRSAAADVATTGEDA